MRSGIILAGGEARRAGGKEKYFFNHCGETFISRLISTLNEIVDEVIIVARDNDQCRRFSGFTGVRVVPDRRQGRVLSVAFMPVYVKQKEISSLLLPVICPVSADPSLNIFSMSQRALTLRFHAGRTG